MIKSFFPKFGLIYPIFLSLIFSFSAIAEEETYNSITVLASSSLSEAITEIAKLYSKKEGTTVSANFQSTETLSDSILAGESADIYISENKVRFNDLKQRGILDVYSVTELAANKLVLVISKENNLEKKLSKNASAEKLLMDLSEKTLITMGDPDSTPSGFYARKILENLGLWQNFEQKIVRAEDSKHSLYLISKGGGAGIVYLSDAYGNKEVRILAEFQEPANKDDKIIYKAAVVASENMAPARRFLEFLKSPEARKILEWYGFGGI